MEAITYLQLKTNMSMIQEIKDFSVEQSINNHAYCYLTGIIDETYKDDYVKKVNAENQIEVFVEGEKHITLFKGLIEHIQVKLTGGLYVVEIKGVSHSFQTDIQRKSRSFQNHQMTYEDLIKEVMSTYAGGAIIDFASDGQAIGQMIMQYNETDWAFLKRVASDFNQGVIAVVTLEGPKVIFGTPNGTARGAIEHYHYTVSKNIGAYKRSSENTNLELEELDAVTFHIETLDNYEIGDKVSYQQKTLYIKKKEIQMKEGILYFRYDLCIENGLSQDKVFNEQIVGLSLKGKVLQVVQDRIKVHLEIDKNQDQGTAWEFPYTTTYTAEGSSGWYCMPEIGDNVGIYFPTKEEGQGVGMNALRIGSKGTDKIDNPSIKYFRTINGKELKFGPDEIVITCVNGVDPETGENKMIYISLNDKKGIEIISSEPITFKSDKGIKLEAEETIHILASEQIKLRCKKSEIRMDTMVDICGPEVKIN